MAIQTRRRDVVKAKPAMATVFVSMFCLAAGPALAVPPTNGVGYRVYTPNASGQTPQFIDPYRRDPRQVAEAFSAAFAAAPSAILKSREGRSNIVLSDVPVHACDNGSRAAFTMDRNGHVEYGCETATDGHFLVCWKGYGCHRYESSKWDMVALTKPLHP